MSQLAAQRVAEASANCTFHPALSQRSLRMARRLETGFQARQQQHLLKRQKMVGLSLSLFFTYTHAHTHTHTPLLQIEKTNFCKRSRPITLPTSFSPHQSTPSPNTLTHSTTTSPTSRSVSDTPRDQTRGRQLFSRPAHHSQSSSSASRVRKSPVKTRGHGPHTTGIHISLHFYCTYRPICIVL